MSKQRKPLVWLHGEVKTPPFSADARIEAGGFNATPARGHQYIAATRKANAQYRSRLS